MKVVDLESIAKQTEFSELVGTSQPAIQKLCAKAVLIKGQTTGQWLTAYCHRLRAEAGGRAADNSTKLTEVRIEESRENTLGKRQDRLQKAGVLVSVDDVSEIVEELANTIQSTWISAGDRIIESISSTHKIELSDDLVYEPLRNSLRNLATRTQELIDSFQGDDRGDNT